MDYVEYLKRNIKSLELIAFHSPKKAQNAIRIMKYICENCDDNNQLTIMQKDLELALNLPHGTASLAIRSVLIPAGIIVKEGDPPATITLLDDLIPNVTGAQIKFLRKFNETFQETTMKTMCWSEEKHQYGFYTMSKSAVAVYQEKQRNEMLQQYRGTVEYLLQDMGCEKIVWEIPSLFIPPKVSNSKTDVES